ncbi:hypothetical protein FH972_023967 [Carpinus fangiana]|uniref:Uncharacterized protein n=1 Tax=Carpinus fangiana TaxID=176857 RepID=A0A5N6KWN8_9ROSI|nr:hypothetical protein FH972_023967 [Carpinus fangiana]
MKRLIMTLVATLPIGHAVASNNGILATVTKAGPITKASQFDSILSGLTTDLVNVGEGFGAGAVALGQIIPTSIPTSIPQVLSTLQTLIPGPSNNPAELFHLAAAFLLSGISPTNSHLDQYIEGYTTSTSLNNSNSINPSPPIYPSLPGDAPYSLSEATLRAAIHIPPTFTYGAAHRMPLLMVPGTATPGVINFAGNFHPLLSHSPLLDPVWLAIPNASQSGAQLTAEYIAYAVHYLAAIARSNVTILTWSQGGIDAQWALQYWPSVRARVPDVVAFSPDYHGTLFSDAQCAAFPPLPCPPAARQQRTDSTFLKVLRAGGGGSAWVPTTTVYSAFFDEIVIPQADPNASAFLLDERGVGVSNNEVQKVCKGAPAGGFFTHEGTLYNSLGYALLIDAVTHEGPADISRLDLEEVCSHVVTPGLGLADVLVTEGIIPVAALLILNATQAGTLQEPAIKPYALK